MSDEFEYLQREFNKSKIEFDIAATCLVRAIEAFNERIEKVEKWIERQKNPHLN